MHSRGAMDPRRDAIEGKHASGEVVAAGSVRRLDRVYGQMQSGDGSHPPAAPVGAMTDVRRQLVVRMRALLEEIERCEPGEEDWW